MLTEETIRAKIKANDERVYLLRAKAEFEKHSKESMEVINNYGTFYAFGSELACLRLFLAYNKVARNGLTRIGFNDERKSFYFSLEVKN